MNIYQEHNELDWNLRDDDVNANSSLHSINIMQEIKNKGKEIFENGGPSRIPAELMPLYAAPRRQNQDDIQYQQRKLKETDPHQLEAVRISSISLNVPALFEFHCSDSMYRIVGKVIFKMVIEVWKDINHIDEIWLWDGKIFSFYKSEYINTMPILVEQRMGLGALVSMTLAIDPKQNQLSICSSSNPYKPLKDFILSKEPNEGIFSLVHKVDYIFKPRVRIVDGEESDDGKFKCDSTNVTIRCGEKCEQAATFVFEVDEAIRKDYEERYHKLREAHSENYQQMQILYELLENLNGNKNVNDNVELQNKKVGIEAAATASEKLSLSYANNMRKMRRGNNIVGLKLCSIYSERRGIRDNKPFNLDELNARHTCFVYSGKDETFPMTKADNTKLSVFSLEIDVNRDAVHTGWESADAFPNQRYVMISSTEMKPRGESDISMKFRARPAVSQINERYALQSLINKHMVDINHVTCRFAGFELGAIINWKFSRLTIVCRKRWQEAANKSELSAERLAGRLIKEHFLHYRDGAFKIDTTEYTQTNWGFFHANKPHELTTDLEEMKEMKEEILDKDAITSPFCHNINNSSPNSNASRKSRKKLLYPTLRKKSKPTTGGFKDSVDRDRSRSRSRNNGNKNHGYENEQGRDRRRFSESSNDIDLDQIESGEEDDNVLMTEYDNNNSSSTNEANQYIKEETSIGDLDGDHDTKMT